MTGENGKQLTKPQALKDTLEKARSQFLSVLPKDQSIERLLRGFMLAAVNNPKLYECTGLSILSTVMEAATLGLDFSRAMGQAYAVPYGKECVLIPGYRGLIGLARRSGDVMAVWARNVYAAEDFKVVQGTEERIYHEPRVKGECGDYIGSYAVAVMPDGTRQFEWMPNEDIEKIRNRSKAKNSGPWVTDTDEMRRKTVVRRLLKYLPMSPELARAIESEDNAEAGIHADKLIDVTPEPQPSKADTILDDVSVAAVKLDLQEPATADDVEARWDEMHGTGESATSEQHERQPGEEPEQTELATDEGIK